VNRRIPLLRGLAIIAVVINHAVLQTIHALIWQGDRYRGVAVPDYGQIGSLAYWALSVLCQLALVSVPAFVVIAAFSANYARARANSDWKAIRAWVLNLLVPYLVWSAIVLLGSRLGGSTRTPLQALGDVITGTVSYGFFFVPLLIQFYFLSPLLFRFARSSPRMLLIISIGLHLILVFLSPIASIWGAGLAMSGLLESIRWTFLPWLIYFVLGLLLAMNLQRVTPWFRQHRTALLISTLVWGMLSVVEGYVVHRTTLDLSWTRSSLKVSSTPYAISAIALFVAWDIRESSITRQVQQLGRFSFGIFILNFKIIGLSSGFFYVFLPVALGQPFVLMALFVILGIGVPWGLMNLVARSPARRVYRYLFG
jgi:membrane-bound acyltransferase YfiQ involved in biofilm formation